MAALIFLRSRYSKYHSTAFVFPPQCQVADHTLLIVHVGLDNRQKGKRYIRQRTIAARPFEDSYMWGRLVYKLNNSPCVLVRVALMLLNWAWPRKDFHSAMAGRARYATRGKIVGLEVMVVGPES